MYELIAEGEEIVVEDELMFAIQSNGKVFPIMSAAELAGRSG